MKGWRGCSPRLVICSFRWWWKAGRRPVSVRPGKPQRHNYHLFAPCPSQTFEPFAPCVLRTPLYPRAGVRTPTLLRMHRLGSTGTKEKPLERWLKLANRLILIRWLSDATDDRPIAVASIFNISGYTQSTFYQIKRNTRFVFLFQRN